MNDGLGNMWFGQRFWAAILDGRDRTRLANGWCRREKNSLKSAWTERITLGNGVEGIYPGA